MINLKNVMLGLGRRREANLASSSPSPEQASEPQFHPLIFNSANSQDFSPLFNKLPPETRELICSYALAPFEDASLEAQFNDDTCFKRPNYSAHLKHDTMLLRTCRRIYSEAWHLPWTTRQQVFYFTWSERRPDGSDEGVQTVEKMQRALNVLHECHGDVQLDGGVRIFAQLLQLENGRNFDRVMSMQHFCPKTVTVTIRHTDWWFWENDEPMRIASDWVCLPRLPDSVREVRLEFESLERRKDQVNALAGQACDYWLFFTKSGRRLAASKNELETERWSGSSTWAGKQWKEDEAKGKPNVLDYYIGRIAFRTSNEPWLGYPYPFSTDKMGNITGSPYLSNLVAPMVGLRPPPVDANLESNEGAEADEDGGQSNDEESGSPSEEGEEARSDDGEDEYDSDDYGLFND